MSRVGHVETKNDGKEMTDIATEACSEAEPRLQETDGKVTPDNSEARLRFFEKVVLTQHRDEF